MMKFPFLEKSFPECAKLLQSEMHRQQNGIDLIPSENYASPAVIEAIGSHFTNKYSEGYPKKRYYGGQQFTDIIEEQAITQAKKIFRAEHANVQPLSGAVMNIASYFALAEMGDTILGMDLSHGGHLTHGHPVTHMAKIFNFVRYKTDLTKNGEINFDEMLEVAKKERPKIIVAGFSAYSKNLNWKKFKEIADEVGAYTLADVSHIGGLIAGNVLENPLDFGFDVMTTTTHKSLRGPRGGLILCKEELAKKIDKAVFPGLQGGPLMNAVFAKLICFLEADTLTFHEYAEQVIKNAQTLYHELDSYGFRSVYGKTENHLLLLDMTPQGVTGDEAEKVLDSVSLTVNKNMIPDDKRKPLDPSGIRLGTPGVTTRGMKEAEMKRIAEYINRAIQNRENEGELHKLRGEILEFAQKFPVPGVTDV